MTKTYSNKLSELRISQAYIKLLGLPQNEQGARMISLERIGNHEVLMFDVSPDSATDAQVVLFNLFNFGGIVVVSVLGIAALLIIARRWDRPVRDTIRGSR